MKSIKIENKKTEQPNLSPKPQTKPKAFTLVELLIAVAIVAVLSGVVILTLKPQDMLRQARDSRRLNDLSNLTRALNYIIANEPNSYLGNPNTVYVSLPDPNLQPGQTSTCPNMDLPPLPSGYNYQCVSESNLTNTDGTGWIPINFSNQPIFKVTKLPTDPKNDPNNYYIYISSSTNFELNSNLESEKYKHLLTEDNGDNNFLYETGNKLTLYPLSGIGQNMALKNESGQFVKSDQGYAIYLAQAASQGQVAFFIAPDQVSGDNYLYWDNSNKRLGIWTSSPGSKLSISGGVSIGSSYASQAAPTDGLIVQGNVGIGTTGPIDKLDVSGNIQLSGNVKFDKGGIDHGISYYSASIKFTDSNGTITYNSFSGYHAFLGNGIERVRITNNGNVGIGTTTPAYKLDVSGDIRTTGCLVYNGGTLGTCSSEEELKNIIGPFQIEGALDKIIKLQPIKYTFKSDPSSQILIGLLAQDTEKIIPELIETKDGQKQIKYGELQWLQIEAMKELEKQVKELKNENKKLIEQIKSQQSQIEELKLEIQKLKFK